MQNQPPPNQLDWNKAETYLKETQLRYTKIGAVGAFALSIAINPLLKRFERGERTINLYDDIMALS